MTKFSTTDYWRAIILFGLNTATYKLALGQCLSRFAADGRTQITLHDLAETFFDVYLTRLETGKPQLILPNRLTVMERIVALYKAERLNREQAIDRVAQQAFRDVVPRFHTVNGVPLPVQFYEHTGERLTLTDDVFHLFSSPESADLLKELDSRWSLLEAAFDLRRTVNVDLANDIRRIYLVRGHDRTDITGMRPVLNGYQLGVCFYCAEVMADSDIHVDHVIPRQLVNHDEIWNLVLAHSFCNQQKSDALPDRKYVEKLIARNEHFIASNHPIKDKLVEQLGPTPAHRRACVQRVYSDAQLIIPYPWSGLRGYDPETDPFYRSFIRTYVM